MAWKHEILVLPLCGLTVTAAGTRVKAFCMSDTRCCGATYFPNSEWLLSCTFFFSPCEALEGSKFRVVQPTRLFPWTLLFLLQKGYVWFSEALERGDFCLAPVLLRRCAALAGVISTRKPQKWVGSCVCWKKKNKQKKTTRSKCTAVNLVQRQNQAFFLSPLFCFPSFFFPWTLIHFLLWHWNDVLLVYSFNVTLGKMHPLNFALNLATALFLKTDSIQVQ